MPVGHPNEVKRDLSTLGDAWRRRRCRIERAVAIASLRCADLLFRVVARLFWSGRIDAIQASNAFRVTRTIRHRAIRLALRTHNPFGPKE